MTIQNVFLFRYISHGGRNTVPLPDETIRLEVRMDEETVWLKLTGICWSLPLLLAGDYHWGSNRQNKRHCQQSPSR